MNWNILVQTTLFLATIILLVKPLGTYMAYIYEGKPCGINEWFSPIERWIYRVCGVRQDTGMDWKTYAVAAMLFNIIGIVVVYFIQRLQAYLPVNPVHHHVFLSTDGYFLHVNSSWRELDLAKVNPVVFPVDENGL